MSEETTEKKHSPGIFRDNIWQFIGVMIAVIAFAWGIYTFVIDKDHKELQVLILSQSSPIQVQSSFASDIHIFYKDEEISNLTTITVKLENTGNVTIRREDFEKPLAFSFPESATLLEAKLVNADPDNLSVELESQDNLLQLSPLLLNSSDRFILEFILIDIPKTTNKPFEIDARIADIQKVEVIDAIESSSEKSVIDTLPPVVLVLVFAATAFGSFLLTAISFRFVNDVFFIALRMTETIVAIGNEMIRRLLNQINQ